MSRENNGAVKLSKIPELAKMKSSQAIAQSVSIRIAIYMVVFMLLFGIVIGGSLLFARQSDMYNLYLFFAIVALFCVAIGVVMVISVRRLYLNSMEHISREIIALHKADFTKLHDMVTYISENVANGNLNISIDESKFDENYALIAHKLNNIIHDVADPLSIINTRLAEMMDGNFDPSKIENKISELPNSSRGATYQGIFKDISVLTFDSDFRILD